MKDKIDILRELKMKFNRVLGLAYTAVHGCMTGCRDGSPYTFDRCVALGQVLRYAISHVTGSTPLALEVALKAVETEEQKWVEKGNKLPYDP